MRFLRNALRAIVAAQATNDSNYYRNQLRKAGIDGKKLNWKQLRQAHAQIDLADADILIEQSFKRK